MSRIESRDNSFDFRQESLNVTPAVRMNFEKRPGYGEDSLVKDMTTRKEALATDTDRVKKTLNVSIPLGTEF